MNLPSCITCGEPANQATRLGYMCEKHFRHLAEVCDYCSDPEPPWVYPANDFPMPGLPNHVSRGEWAACQVCHELIENEDWGGLLERSVTRQYGSDSFASIVRPFLKEYHRRFAANRTGPAWRMASA
jgi:hypothetical protein